MQGVAKKQNYIYIIIYYTHIHTHVHTYTIEKLITKCLERIRF